MIVVTGAAGFIGSCLVSTLNQTTDKNICISDDFGNSIKNKNLENKGYQFQINREKLFEFLETHTPEFIFHLGARTDTTEFDTKIFDKLNLNYSKEVFNYCVKKQIPMVYASSAATYGSGELGYKDDEALIPQLTPLNPYGDSKNDFDKWLLEQTEHPPFYAGLKFFNVYGPNEYHKGRMASVILHAFRQIQETGKMKLFRSHNPDFKDGEQMRDFVYVKDVANVLMYLYNNHKTVNSGIYNLGSGKARTFLDLVRATFKALEIDEDISFIDTPEDIRDKYQYFTEASMNKLIETGYNDAFHTLEEGVTDYVKNYLINQKYY